MNAVSQKPSYFVASRSSFKASGKHCSAQRRGWSTSLCQYTQRGVSRDHAHGISTSSLLRAAQSAAEVLAFPKCVGFLPGGSGAAHNPIYAVLETVGRAQVPNRGCLIGGLGRPDWRVRARLSVAVAGRLPATLLGASARPLPASAECLRCILSAGDVLALLRSIKRCNDCLSVSAPSTKTATRRKVWL